MKSKTTWSLLSALVLLSMARGLRAVPSFAKKYGTSCATCHVAYPRLNAFGRAFLYNGFQFPGGREEDIDKTEDEQVELGSESNRKVFPDAIWPNTLPTFSAFSLVIEAEARYLPEGDPRVTFDDIPARARFFSGGNFQDNLSFFAELRVEGQEVEIEAAHIGFDHIIENNGLSVRIGKMHPIIFPFSQARRLTAGYWMATDSLGDNAWNLDRAQRGIEARGVFADRRAIYSVGLVEGRENLANGEKDAYLHVGYKVGGLSLDGSVAEGSPGATRPWMDDSVRFDGFLYRGTATLAEGHDDTFTQVGAGVDLFYDRLNVLAAFAFQKDDRPVVGSDGDGSGFHFLTEATYILYPWLLPNFRYERFREKLSDGIGTEQRLVPGLVALIRANVKCVVFAEIEDDREGFEVNEVIFSLVYGL